MEPSTIQLEAYDQTPLIVYEYGSHANAPTVLLLHGIGEHGRCYDRVAGFLVDAGFRVLVPDHRGHGLSGGTPTHVGSFDDYLQDIDTVLTALVPDDRTVSLIGHSMGGLIAARYAQTRPARVDVLVMLAPLLRLKLHVNRLILAVGRLCRPLIPRARFRTGIRAADLATDDALAERRKQDPLIRNHVTAGWFFAAMDARQAVWHDIDRVLVPTLVVQGTADPVVEPAAADEWSAGLAVPHACHLLEGQLHELHNDPDWRRMLDIIRDWIRTHANAANTVASGGE